MNLHRLLSITCACALLTGCSLATQPATPHPGRTQTPSQVPPPEVSPAPPDRPPLLPTLTSDTAPYANVTALLEGVCFEYLASRAPDQWVWTTPADMASFFDMVDDSDLCPAPVQPATFEFGNNILAGMIQVAQGCDAAYSLLPDAPGDASAFNTIPVKLIVQPGCPYELAEPLLIVVPRPLDLSSANLTLIR